MKKHGLSKSRLLAYRQCPRRLWLGVNHPEWPSEIGAARMATGIQVGEVARGLYPDGVLIAGEDLGQALRDTQRRLAEEHRPLFEATFQADDVLIRVDLLLPDGDAWRLVEVKSAAGVKEYHLIDTAVQAWVATQAGLALSRVEVAHIDTTFVYLGDDDYRGLFHHADVSAEVQVLEPEVRALVIAAKALLAGDDPLTPPGDQCRRPYACPFLSHCQPEIADADHFPLETLPRGGQVVADLRAKGYTDLRDVPAAELSNWRHQRVWRVTRDNQPFLDPQVREVMAGWGWPRYYLDFESIPFAVPLWVGTRPFMQIPFQWSCHIEDAQSEMSHEAFLAADATDPRRAFAESLVACLGTAGPILVYCAAFEGGRLAELAVAFADLAPALLAIRARLLDVLPLARAHYYHRDMRGSWSLKSVLPTLAPELSYENLAVADGGMAMEAFQEMIGAQTAEVRRAQLRQALWQYCERDTWAMVKIAHYFQRQRPASPHPAEPDDE